MNIAEIARLAGVSSAAVSRYFNNGYVSEEKKEAIRRVVEETGYRPSVQAQTLRTKKTRMIGVIVPKIASASIGKVVEGILSVLNESGYQMLLADTQNTPSKELEYLSVFNDKQVDGVIFVATVFTPEHRRILKNMKVPVVIVGQYLAGFSCVYHDDYTAAYQLTRLFFEKGRTNLGYISAIRQDQAVGVRRCQGYQDAVTEMGCPWLAEKYVTADFSIRSGYDKAGELLGKYPDLDGIICATDEMAVGAMQYLREQNKILPDRILLAGFGDSDFSRVAYMPFVTVHYSYEKSGEMAVQLLLEHMKGETATQEIKLGCLVVKNEV